MYSNYADVHKEWWWYCRVSFLYTSHNRPCGSFGLHLFVFIRPIDPEIIYLMLPIFIFPLLLFTIWFHNLILPRCGNSCKLQFLYLFLSFILFYFEYLSAYLLIMINQFHFLFDLILIHSFLQVLICINYLLLVFHLVFHYLSKFHFSFFHLLIVNWLIVNF